MTADLNELSFSVEEMATTLLWNIHTKGFDWFLAGGCFLIIY
jgi:hypothetical protein